MDTEKKNEINHLVPVPVVLPDGASGETQHPASPAPTPKPQAPRKSSLSQGLTYSWKNINVWTGSPPTTAVVQGGGGEAGPVRTDVEKNKKSCCHRKREPPRQLLNNVSGIVRPGELVAIMGASGAGKTTLLNVLNFRNTSELKVSGERCLNGVRVGPAALTALSAYVQQDDLFFGSLTIKEHLTFQARVRMHSSIPSDVRKKRVEEVIREFGLTKSQNTKIGTPGRIKGISGGEMKRLAFASEVLTDPLLLFCDEPTSGLDSYMAETIVTAMKALASKGKTIICTIHQPSSQVYALFDRLLLVAEGRAAFLGNAGDVLPFFAENGYSCPPNFNPADFYIQTLAVQPGKETECKERITRICDRFADSPGGVELKKSVESIIPEEESEEFLKKAAKAEKMSPYKLSWMGQFCAVFMRACLIITKDPFVLRLRILQTIIMSLLIGGLFYDQKTDQHGIQGINGAIYLQLMVQTMQNCFGVCDTFCVEVPVFLREHFNGMYRVDVYFLAKTTAELPLYVFLPILYISLNYYMIGFQPDFESFLKFTSVLVLVATVAVSIGYFVSCIAPSFTFAIALLPPLIIPFMIFGGFLMNADEVPKVFYPLQYSSFFYYGTEALSVIQWGDIRHIACNTTICLHNGTEVLEMLSYKEKNLEGDIYLLGVILVAFRFLAFLALLIRARRH